MIAALMAANEEQKAAMAAQAAQNKAQMAAYEARLNKLETQLAAKDTAATPEPAPAEAKVEGEVMLAENEAQTQGGPELVENTALPGQTEETLASAEPLVGLAESNGLVNIKAPVQIAALAPQEVAPQAAEVGTGNSATGTGSFAAGNNSSANGIGALALGNAANAVGNGAIAFGSGASASAAGAVAIGLGATASRPNQIAIGTSGNTYTLAGINSAASLAAQSGALQLVTADPLGNLGTSSLNIATLQGFGTSLTGLDTRTSALEQAVAINLRQNNGGIAAAMALGGTTIVPDSNWSMSFNLSTYEGEQGFSSSIVGRMTDNIFLSAGIAGSTVGGTTGGRVGVTFGF
ncbi:hypothetical protein A8B75_19965 [Sphingomonadales bacterium EhC05]|nr:hypothetical protein A8B75_19965 [Sphingomonadales bacterium EhC05]